MKSKTITEDQKQIIKEILTRDFISSEESDVEDIDGTRQHVIVVKPLPWRGEKANRVLRKLDNKAKKQKTKQSVIQTLPRVIGEVSSRPKPAAFTDDFWGFTAN